MTDIDRLLRACATSVGRRAMINLKTLRSIEHHLWPDIARAIIELDDIDPRAKLLWLDLFVLDASIVYFNPDLDLAVAFARKVRPAYGGGDVVLYRGQLGSNPPGMSWSCLPPVAKLYATGAGELLGFAQQLRQLGEVHRVPVRFIAISMI